MYVLVGYLRRRVVRQDLIAGSQDYRYGSRNGVNSSAYSDATRRPLVETYSDCVQFVASNEAKRSETA